MVCLLLAGCGTIQMCFERPKDIRNVHKYPEQMQLTATDLKEIVSDTSRFKVITIYSTCCRFCHYRFPKIDPLFWKNEDSSQVSFYYVLNDTSPMKYAEQYRYKFHLPGPIYYSLDTIAEFANLIGGKKYHPEKWNNITNYVFPGQGPFLDCYYVPATWIVNKHGTVKRAWYIAITHTQDGQDSIIEQQFRTLSLEDLKCSVQEIDFDKIDTVIYVNNVRSEKKLQDFHLKGSPFNVCLPNGKC